MSIMLKAAGLHTFNNDLDAVPAGALLKAENTIIDRDSIIESRRGFKQYATISILSTDRAKQLLIYKDRILTHYSDKLAFDNGSGIFTDFSGNYSELEPGLRIKGLEANGNFYFTTIAGIKKISATSASQFTSAANYIKDAGAVKALDVEAIINYSIPGFFSPEAKVAYRIVWGYKDQNENVLLGVPSSRTVVVNTSTTSSAVVDLSFPIPEEITSNNLEYFYQVYRTAVKELGVAPSLDDIDPGDEMYLVLEDFPTTNELTVTRMISVQDITPEDFRASGALLYTNLNSGEGINRSNEVPPIAKDIALFSDSVFFANTKTSQTLSLSLLSVSQLITSVSKFTITNGTTSNTYTFVGIPEITEFTFDTQANTTDGSYFLINAASNIRKYFVWFNKTGTTPQPTGLDTIDRLPIEVDISGATTNIDVAQLVLTAIDAVTDFSATRLGAVVTVLNTNNGEADDAINGTIPVSGVFAINVTQQGDGEDLSLNHVLLSGAPTPAQQIDETARSLVKVINQNVAEDTYAFYLSGPDDLPGLMSLESRNIDDPIFYLGVNSTATGSQFNPILPVTQTGTVAIGTGTVTITAASHGYSNGASVVIYNSTSTPTINNTYTISNVTLNTFDISATVTISGNVDILITTDVSSENEVRPNRLYFSKFQQPEAVPALSYIDVGPKDQAILRIVALRDSLFIFKEDGIYRLTGVQEPTWSVSLFDNSVVLLAPDTCSVLNNQIYCLTTQGIARITDTGVGVISRPIEDKIQKVIVQNTNYKTISFGVSYETDRAYFIFLPSSSSDTEPSYALRFNTFTNTWTEWDRSNVSGIVNPADDKLYLGATSPIIEQERKQLSRKDYADYEFILSVGANSVDDTTITLSSNIGISSGDIIVQTQYVTISTYNRLLKKLDLDISLQHDYFSTLEMMYGDDLSNKMTLLVNKLNADPSTALLYSFSGTSDPVIIQTEFNVIITTLNADPGVFLTNYVDSTGSQEIEGQILTPIKNTNKVILRLAAPFIVGNIIHYVGIPNTIIYAPQHFGDTSVLKQVNEATFIFEDTVFTTARVAYNSDLSPNFEYVNFEGVGDGSWGNFVWGEQSWGGEGDQVPLRTYIPLEKQRCRFIRPRFEHSNAWEHYAIQGISLNPRPLSTRGYR